MEEGGAAQYLPYVALINLTLVSLLLMGGGWFLARKRLNTGVPEGRQNVAEAIMDFFYGHALRMGRPEVTPAVSAFLATCFLLILVSNAVAMVPIPFLNYPPTAYFSITLGLALCAVGGTLALSGAFNGPAHTLKHLVWPNPLQIVSEITDVLSLSLRLFGNIAGEYLTLVLVSSAIAVGIPLILHVLGLIPTFVQALVFTLLTASFLAGALERHPTAEDGDAVEVDALPDTTETESDLDANPQALPEPVRRAQTPEAAH